MSKLIESDLKRLLKHFVDCRPVVTFWENGDGEFTGGPFATESTGDTLAFRQLEEVAAKIVDHYFKVEISDGENAVGVLIHSFYLEKKIGRQLRGSHHVHEPYSSPSPELDDFFFNEGLCFDEQTQIVFTLEVMTNGFTLVRDILKLILENPTVENPMTDEECKEALQIYPERGSWPEVAKALQRQNVQAMKAAITRFKKKNEIKTEPMKRGRKKGT